jgi:hypothetical protein
VDAQGLTHNLPPEQTPVSEEVPPESRAVIPYLPGTNDRRESRPSMELGAMGLVRTRTFTDAVGSTGAYVDFELTPGIAVNADVGAFTFALGYAPRLTLPSVSQGLPLLVLNNGTAQVIWRVASAWTLVAQGSGSYGDNNQLTPTLTPGSPPAPGNPGTAPTPVTTFDVYRYIGISAWLRASGQLSGRTTLRLAAGWTDVGGLGDDGQAAQPRTWGPQGAATLEWDVTATGRLATTLSGQIARFVGGFSVQMGTLTESFRLRPMPGTELVFAAGAAMTSTTPTTNFNFGHVLPVVTASLVYSNSERARQPLRVNVDLGLGPYIDPYVQLAYQRFTGSLGLEWRPSQIWVLGATLSAALVPYKNQPVETYGSAGVSAGLVPWSFLQFNVGAFTTRQLQGGSVSTQDFRQFTFLFSATLRDTFYL